MKIKVTWEVEDNYAGGSRPHSTMFDTEWYDDWEELSDDLKKRCIEEVVQEDFDQKITFSITDYGLKK